MSETTIDSIDSINTMDTINTPEHHVETLTTDYLNQQLLQLNQQLERCHEQLQSINENSQSIVKQTEGDVAHLLQSITLSLQTLRHFADQLGIDETRKVLTDLEQQQHDATLTLESNSAQILEEIQLSATHLDKALKANTDRWERAANFCLKSTAELTQNLNPEAFQQISQQSCHAVEQSAQDAIMQFKQLGRWFHWKNILLVAVAVMAAMLFTSWYITDQYPWETHQTIATERLYGKAAIQAWRDLTPQDQQRIARYLKHKLV